jgi:hypothetical protein
VSIHEAGHAVACALTGVRLAFVQITPSPRYQPCEGQRDCGQGAVVALAGAAAEQELLGSADARGSRKDRVQARRYTMALPGRDQRVALSLAGQDDDPLDQARTQARQLVQEERDRIMGLAAVLLVKGQLDGEDIEAILDQPAPTRARLGLYAASAVAQTDARGDWYDWSEGSRRLRLSLAQEHGDWLRACHAAASRLLGAGAPRPAWALTRATLAVHPSPPGRGG